MAGDQGNGALGDRALLTHASCSCGAPAADRTRRDAASTPSGLCRGSGAKPRRKLRTSPGSPLNRAGDGTEGACSTERSSVNPGDWPILPVAHAACRLTDRLVQWRHEEDNRHQDRRGAHRRRRARLHRGQGSRAGSGPCRLGLLRQRGARHDAFPDADILARREECTVQEETLHYNAVYTVAADICT